MATYKYVNDTGLIVVDAADLRRVVEEEMKSIFGQDLVVTSNTPQGRLIDAEVLARRSVMEAMAMVANQINPNYTRGPFLDSLCSFLDLERRGRTRSILENVEMTGVPNTTISEGSIARDQNGVSWKLTKSARLNEKGKATGDFICLEDGPISCPVGSLSRVSVSAIGWETVRNPQPAILGLRRQSDPALKALRKNTLAKQGASTPEAILSHIYDYPVYARSMVYRENITNKQQVIDGINMPPHSWWVCVQGGTNKNIANALLVSKTIGANWVGKVLVKVKDEESGQEYPVRFDRPKAVPITITVSAIQGEFTGDLYTSVVDAVLLYAKGEIEGYEGFVVKDLFVSPTMIATGIQALVKGASIYTIEIARRGEKETASPIKLDLNEYATISRAEIKIKVLG